MLYRRDKELSGKLLSIPTWCGIGGSNTPTDAKRDWLGLEASEKAIFVYNYVYSLHDFLSFALSIQR